MKKQTIFYSRVLLAVLAWLGIGIEIYKYGIGMLLYYTVLSNILVAGFITYTVYLMWKKSDISWQTAGFLRIKGGVTMSIMITCVIYHFMLAPLADDFWRVENILCHYIVPLYFFLDTLILDRARTYHWLDPLRWTSVPLLYMGFALLNGLVFKLPIPDAKDSPFPYFFLNVTKYGWGYVLQMASIIFIAYLVFGYFFYGIKRLTFGKTI